MVVERRRVFRFHGSFCFSREADERCLPQGVIDIVEERDVDETQLYLYWHKDGEADLSKASIAGVPNWHADADSVWETISDLADNSDASLAFAIGDPGGGTHPVPLDISGVLAFDRIDQNQMAAPRPTVDMRIPCVTAGAAADQSWIKIGAFADNGTPVFFYSYQLAVPLPAGLGHINAAPNQPPNPWLALGAHHATHVPDPAGLQKPAGLFAKVGHHTSQKHYTDDAPRFGDVSLVHFADATDPTRLNLHEHLVLSTDQVLEDLGVLRSGHRPRRPNASRPETHHEIALSTAEGTSDLTVTAKVQVERVDFLRLDAQLGRRIAPQNKLLSVQTALTVSVDDEALRNGDTYQCKGRVKIDLAVRPREDADPLLLTAADDWMDAERAALRIVKGQPQSFLPKFDIHPHQNKRWVEVTCFIGTRATFARGELPVLEIDPALGAIPPVSMTLARAEKLSIRVAFPGADLGAEAKGHTGEKHSFHLLLNAQYEVLKPDWRIERSGVFFNIVNDKELAHIPHDTGHHSAPLQAQLGSMAMVGVRRKDGSVLPLIPQKSGGSLTLRPDPAPSSNKILHNHLDTATRRQPRHELDLVLRFQLADVRPVASDVPHGDRDTLREDWLVPASGPNARGGEDALYALEVTERLGAEQDHHLIANLFEFAAESPLGFDDVLLTRAPFGLMRLRRSSFESLASAASANFATYDSDKRTWQFKGDGNLVPISFPAGATGESMDKPGQRAINDRRPGAEVDASHHVRSRFSGPTTLWADTTAFGRNFRTPEHNARALFSDWTESGPGAELAGFATELVYGLSTAWTRPRNTTALNTTVRVVESATLMGRMVGARDTTGTPSPSITNRWPALTRAIAEQPQHLETVSRREGSVNEYTPARFDTGLVFAGRNTAVMKPPLNGIALYQDTAPRIAEHGLDGGAFWAIEQRAFMNAVLAASVSSDGTLENFTISPFGSSGEQVARFVNGAMAIITRTRLGRLEGLRVEIKGRIAAFYHRAKHVVVYRRTTAASDQFEGLGGDSERPILRKVEEYIELEETARAYPDRAGIDPRSVGPLRQLRFGTTRINVDSAWADDVGESGWRVPLWNRLSANERPVVYPMPSITAAFQGEDVERHTLQELCDPSKLHFYTNAGYALKESDTDLWPAVAGVDGVNTADLDVWMREQDKASIPNGTLEKGRRPAASRFIPGAVGFTHCVASTAGLTKLNEARSDRPVFAALESFTFLRGGGTRPATTPKVMAALLKPSEGLKKLLSDLELEVDPNAGPQVLHDIVQAKGELETALAEAIKDDDPAAYKAALDSFVDKLKPEIKKVKDLADADADQLAQAVFGSKLNELKTQLENDKTLGLIEDVLKADKEDCEKLVEQARTAIRAKKLLVRERLADTETRLLNALEASTRKEDLKSEIERIRSSAIGIANDTVARVEADLGNVRALVTDARALVRDWGADLDRAYRSGMERVATYRASYDAEKPWSPERLDKAQAALTAELANLNAEASAALTQTRQRMASEIKGRASEATVVIDAALREAQAELSSGSPVSSVAAFLLEANPDERQALLDAAPKAEVEAVTTALQAAIAALPAGSDDRKKALEALKRRVETLTAEAKVYGGVVDKSLAKSRAQFGKDLNELAGEATSLLAYVADETNAVVTDLDAQLQTDLKALTDNLNTATGDLRAAIESFPPAKQFDELVKTAEAWITSNGAKLKSHAERAEKRADDWLATAETELKDASDKLTEGLQSTLKDDVIAPIFDAVDEAVDAASDDMDQVRAELRGLIETVSDDLEKGIDALDGVASEITSEALALCKALVKGKNDLLGVLTDEALKVGDWAGRQLDAYVAKISNIAGATLEELRDAYDELGDVLSDLGHRAGDLLGATNVYISRAVEHIAGAAEALGRELAGNLPRLVAAGGKIPDIGNLGLNTDRIVAYLKDFADDIDVSLNFSSLGRFGDALGAFNFDMPVTGLGDGFDLPDLDLPDLPLPDLNLDDLLPNIAGINFKDLAPDFGGAGNSLRDLKQYVKITHDLDKKSKSAWVKAELDIPFPKRAKLFGLGPFNLFLKKPELTAWVRIEASAKTKEVTTTDHGEVKTDLEAVVSGQPMVTLRDVVISYDQDGGLDFDIDPKKIKLHPNFQFVQDVLDGLGLGGDNGLNLIKEDGLPVGIEYKIAMPVPPINAGTSGLVDLTIANAFQLRAYPDFYIKNRFNLSTRERPFIFSIFIIGGTGFVQLDVDHKPAVSPAQTNVVVTAGVGGSASLAFAFGPISGGVFITLTVILTYKKYFPRPPAGTRDAGLSIALELAIAGHVSLWGIATILLRLGLSMTYHESGRIDATGRLKATLRVSRFFKLSYSTTVRYQLREGKSVTTRQESTSVDLDPELKKRAKKLKQARAKL